MSEQENYFHSIYSDDKNNKTSRSSLSNCSSLNTVFTDNGSLFCNYAYTLQDRNTKFAVFSVWSISEFCESFPSEAKLLECLESLSKSSTIFVSVSDALQFKTSEAQFILEILKQYRKKSSELRSEGIRKGISFSKEEGRSWGRPQKLNDQAIQDLRLTGLTMQEIADTLKISVGSVHRVLSKF